MPPEMAHIDEPEPKFAFGQITSTRNALNTIPQDEILLALSRHVQRDWGDVDEHDRKVNEVAFRNGGRLFSIYHSLAGVKFYVITEANRTFTTVLLPSDY